MDLDPVDVKLLMLADNKTGELSFWDDDKLSSLIDELKDEDLGGLGWDDGELDFILSRENERSEEYIAKEGEELDIENFDNFENTCPRCGFEWD
tara:strand:- start:660 stop:941 length:282 start_codon:yes stop_codon:yes gene_type:complete